MYQYKAEVLNVVDGDTIDCKIDLGFQVYTKKRIRLARIDTPEIHFVSKDSEEYEKGIESKKFVVKMIGRSDDIIIDTKKVNNKGKYGRYIGEVYCIKDGEKINLNDKLLEGGLASYYGE